MRSRVPDDFQFLIPWFRCEPGLEIQLRREAPPGHCLFGIEARSVARHHHDDDVLFELFGDDAPATFAVVHLTWKNGPEVSPDFPGATLYARFEDWVTSCMEPEANELTRMRRGVD